MFIEENTTDFNTSSSPRNNNNPIIDYLDFEDGYEKALAAVFSDELMASINEEQSSFWRSLESNQIPPFPEGVIPFTTLIKAPDNLKKRLEYIGLIQQKRGRF